MVGPKSLVGDRPRACAQISTSLHTTKVSDIKNSQTLVAKRTNKEFKWHTQEERNTQEIQEG